jgi:hypothetical protein
MDSLARFDVQGHAIPFAGDDGVIEAVAALTDPESDTPPELWGPEWDAHVWEPTDADCRPSVLEESGITDEDWADYMEWCDRLDALMDLHDADTAADRRDTLARLHEGAGR